MGLKKNCWEHMNCGREKGGKNAVALGVCPAAADNRLNGVHDGKNGGRACWVIAGTLCGGAIQGTFGAKFKTCEQCGFYQNTKAEEGPNFRLSVILLNKLKPAQPAGKQTAATQV